MDYKALIDRLKYYGTAYAIGDNLGREIDGTDQLMLDAVTTIETLLAERDAAKAAPAPEPKRSIERMDYRRFAYDLRKAADYFKENRPDFPDVIATYKKCAEVIETLLEDKSETEKEI